MLTVLSSGHPTILGKQVGQFVVLITYVIFDGVSLCFHEILTPHIMPRTSAILTSSDYVELPTFNLCFLDMFTMVPLPMDMMAPVCPLLS